MSALTPCRSSVWSSASNNRQETSDGAGSAFRASRRFVRGGDTTGDELREITQSSFRCDRLSTHYSYDISLNYLQVVIQNHRRSLSSLDLTLSYALHHWHLGNRLVG